MLLLLVDARFFDPTSLEKSLGIALFALNLLFLFLFAQWRKTSLLSTQVMYYMVFGCLYPALAFIETGQYPQPNRITLFSPDDVLQAQLILFLGTVSFSLALIAFLSPKAPYSGVAASARDCISWRFYPALLACIAVYGFGMAAVWDIGLDVIISKRMDVDDVAADSGDLGYGLFKRAQVLLFAATFVLFYLARASCPMVRRGRRVAAYIVASIMAVGLFVVVNPINSARWRIIGFSLALILLFVEFRRPLLRLAFVGALFLGMILVYPLMNLIARTSNQWDKVSAGQYMDYFIAGDFDGFQSIVFAGYYVKAHGHTWGQQLAGTLVGFVPRSLFPDRPLPSGELAGRYVEIPNTNISMPIFGEFFIDFGLIGVVALSVALAWLIARAEQIVGLRQYRNAYHYAAIVLATGSAIYLTRGSLIGAVGNISLVILACFALLFVARPRRVVTASAGFDKRMGQYARGALAER